MNSVVLDSSILLASVLPDEPLTQEAKVALLAWEENGTRFFAPRLFRAERVAVVRKAVYQKRIPHERGREYLALLLEYSVEFADDDDLLFSAYEIAARFGLPRAYDAQYLALAERLKYEFWTVDQTLVNTLKGQMNVRWLGDFTAP